MSDSGKIPYFKVNKLLWTWTPCEGENGCRIVQEARLSIDKAPPPLRDQPPVEKTKPVAKQGKPDPAMKMLSDIERVARAFSRFKTWLDTPDPPKEPKPAPIRQEKIIPSFDIQEIPGAMRKLMMPMSAKLMEKWFSGQLNYSPDDAAEQAMLNQDGKPYSSSTIDTTTMRMDWILQYARAKSQFENLTNTLIYSDRARGCSRKN
jgi:hypothetical protein